MHNSSHGPASLTFFSFSLADTDMKPERTLTIPLVSVKYRISETYPVWPLWCSESWKPTGFPWRGPHHAHKKNTHNEGLLFFHTTMENVWIIFDSQNVSHVISKETHTWKRKDGIWVKSSCSQKTSLEVFSKSWKQFSKLASLHQTIP